MIVSKTNQYFLNLICFLRFLSFFLYLSLSLTIPISLINLTIFMQIQKRFGSKNPKWFNISKEFKPAIAFPLTKPPFGNVELLLDFLKGQLTMKHWVITFLIMTSYLIWVTDTFPWTKWFSFVPQNWSCCFHWRTMSSGSRRCTRNGPGLQTFI